MGRRGSINIQLLHSFLEFTAHKVGKSLAREDFEDFVELIPKDLSHEDVLRTSYEYISTYLSKYLNDFEVREVLATGGGAHNTFLIELIQSKTATKVIVPDKEIVDFKEALVFAYLGLLRIENQVNCLTSVTKAKADNVGGAIWG